MNKKYIEDIRKMTENEINSKIAEFCGWTNIKEECVLSEPDDRYLSKALYGDKLFKSSVDKSFITRRQIPIYTEDLNSIYKAENVLLNMGDVWDIYCDNLMDLIVEDEGYQAGELLIHASAFRRTEALLMTIMEIKEIQ
jgi:hypothetical protein